MAAVYIPNYEKNFEELNQQLKQLLKLNEALLSRVQELEKHLGVKHHGGSSETSIDSANA